MLRLTKRERFVDFEVECTVEGDLPPDELVRLLDRIYDSAVAEACEPATGRAEPILSGSLNPTDPDVQRVVEEVHRHAAEMYGNRVRVERR